MLIHHAKVSGRKIAVEPRRVVQHGVNADAVSLELDGEWGALDRVTLVFSALGESAAVPFSGDPVPIPFELMESVGDIGLTVVGRSGADTRVVTERMAMPLRVVPSGDVDGTYEPGDPALDEVQQAIEDARDAAGDARDAAEECRDAVDRLPTIGHGLRLVGGALCVDAAEAVEADNTLPVTSAAVYTEVGNIEALLATV